jgi:hypothetical protein
VVDFDGDYSPEAIEDLFHDLAWCHRRGWFSAPILGDFERGIF